MASIPGHVASSIFGVIKRLEERLIPFVQDVVRESVKDSVDIAHETAEDVLNTVTEELNRLKTTVEQHTSK